MSTVTESPNYICIHISSSNHNQYYYHHHNQSIIPILTVFSGSVLLKFVDVSTEAKYSLILAGRSAFTLQLTAKRA